MSIEILALLPPTSQLRKVWVVGGVIDNYTDTDRKGGTYTK